MLTFKKIFFKRVYKVLDRLIVKKRRTSVNKMKGVGKHLQCTKLLIVAIDSPGQLETVSNSQICNP